MVASPTPAVDLRAAEVARVFALQQAWRPHLRATDAATRLEKLQRLRTVLLRHRQAAHAALYADFGKTPREVDLSELGPTILELHDLRKYLRRWMRPQRVRTPLWLFGSRSEVHYEPKGCALIISPWNFPLMLAMVPLAGAVAAGCTVVLKPSELTPHTSALMKQMLAETFEEREVAVFEGDHTVAQALLQHPFDHVYFTGSPRVGKLVMAAAAPHLTSVTLELGGKSPAVVDATADLPNAVEKIAVGKWLNAGQTCIAPDYVYVQATVYEPFVAALRAWVETSFGATADARQASPDYARVINDAHYARLTGLLEQAVADGATVALGGTGHPASRFFDPTILTGVSESSRVMEEEIFGPVLPVLPFETLDDALAGINRRPKPLSLYVFTRNPQTTRRILGETSAGTTCINDTLAHFIQPELPFGGVNHSGIGKGHGRYGFLAFTNERAVLHQHLRHGPLTYFYPPFTEQTRKLADLLLRWF
jgi:aldehyde dehydrogenase (NAD+)